MINIEEYEILFQKEKNCTKEELLVRESLKSKRKEFAEKISLKLGRFRVGLYESIIKKFISNINNNVVSEPLKINLDKENIMLFTSNKEGVTCSIGINYNHKTDNDLAKLFFRELEDAKFGFATLDVKYFKDKFPEDIVNLIPNYTEYKVGFISFSKS